MVDECWRLKTEGSGLRAEGFKELSIRLAALSFRFSGFKT
jgi:hypothetical protein